MEMHCDGSEVSVVGVVRSAGSRGPLHEKGPNAAGAHVLVVVVAASCARALGFAAIKKSHKGFSINNYRWRTTTRLRRRFHLRCGSSERGFHRRKCREDPT